MIKKVSANDFRSLPDIDECHPKPCVNGTCLDLINDFSCNCTPGFTGKRCDIGM